MWTYYLIIFEINLYDLQPLFLFLFLGIECFSNDLLKISLCWGSWETRKRKWVLLSGRKTGWEITAQLDYQLAFAHPIQLILWTAPYKGPSHQALSRRHQNILWKETIIEIFWNCLFSFLLPLCLSLLSSLPFSFLYIPPSLSFSFLLLSFLLRGSILGRLPLNLQSSCLSFHKAFWL